MLKEYGNKKLVMLNNCYYRILIIGVWLQGPTGPAGLKGPTVSELFLCWCFWNILECTVTELTFELTDITFVKSKVFCKPFFYISSINYKVVMRINFCGEFIRTTNTI